MKPLLAILNARDIPECMESYHALDTPKAWITGYTMHDVQNIAWAQVMAGAREHGYTHMLVTSDDTVVTQDAIDAVLELLADGHPVATGYCNLDATDPRVNLSTRPLPAKPAVDAYAMPTWHDILRGPRTFRTHFSGMSLTAMSLDMWDQYPCQVFGGHPGYSSDFKLCLRLQNDGVPIIASRDAFIYHVKERWNMADQDPAKRLLVGQIQPSVTVEPPAA